MNKLNFTYFQAASRMFLTEQIPDNWLEMEEAEQDKFLLDNAWGHLQNESADKIFNTIDDGAFVIRTTTEQAIQAIALQD